jgi:hypothetical protein
MTQPSFDDDEKPLDPAMERVQARLRRLMLIAGLTLGIGIFAVFAAILYRIVTSDTSGAPAATAYEPGMAVPTLTLGEMGLPEDARLLSTAIDGSRIVLTFPHAGGNSLVFVDADSLAVVGRLEIATE